MEEVEDDFVVGEVACAFEWFEAISRVDLVHDVREDGGFL